MKFAELGNDMHSVIYMVKRSELNTIDGSWPDDIYAKAATYEKHLKNIKAQHRQTCESVSKPPVKFSKREREILRYICQGLTNMEIANTCFISISAVKKTLYNIYAKLGAANRAEAVRIAIQMELYP